MTGNPSAREPMDIEASDVKPKLDKMWPWSRGQAEAAEVEETDPMDISLDRTLRSEEISELEASYKGDAKRRLPELPKTPEQAPSDFPTVFPTYPLPPLLFEKEEKEAETTGTTTAGSAETSRSGDHSATADEKRKKRVRIFDPGTEEDNSAT